MIRIYALIAALLAAAGSASWATYKIEEGRIAKIEVAYDKAQIAAIQEAKDKQASADKVVLDGALKEAAEHVQIVTQTEVITREVIKHVKDTSTCVTYGLVRVLDAATRGDDPGDLALPAGKSDDTCAPVTATALARSVAANYGIARDNAKQLNNLQDTVRQLIAGANGS